MFTSTAMKATIKAGVLSAIAFSGVFAAKPSQAVTLNLPVENFTYNNGAVASPTGNTNTTAFNGFFTQNFGVLGATNDNFLPAPLQAEAVSGTSPFLSFETINKLQSVTLSFDYAFAGGDTFNLLLKNATTGVTTFSTSLGASPTGTKGIAFDLTSFIKTAGLYTVNYQLSKQQTTNAAGFNNVVLNIKQVPEPALTVGLLAVGFAAATAKRKRMR